MPAMLFDYFRRAAEAFVAANRSEDPAAAARLRESAYEWLARVRQREETLRRSQALADERSGPAAAQPSAATATEADPASPAAPERTLAASVVPLARQELGMEQNQRDGAGTPLSSEALKRDEWRGDEEKLRPQDAPGHMLPASEADTAPEDENGAGGPNPIAGTMLPPD